MATFTQTFYPLNGSPSNSTTIKPGLWWNYAKTDSGYSRTSAGSSNDLKKVETFTLTGLPSGVKINSITVEWFTTATRNNGNIYGSYYGWGKGIVYAGTVVDSKAIKAESDTYSGNTSWGQGKMVIPSDRISEYYNSNTKTLSCLFHYGISYPPKSPTSLSGLGQVGYNETTCYWWDIKITVDYIFPYTTLSTPSVTTGTVKLAPKGKTTLRWGASSNLTGGTNKVASYGIYRNGQEIATIDKEETEYTIEYDKDSYSDKEYYYQVRANSSEPGYESALSNRLTIQFCKKISPPSLTLYTDKNNTQATDIYIGKEGQPRITIAWGSLKSFGGKYDSITEISLSNINKSISTSNTSFTLPEDTVLNETTKYTLSITMSSTQTTEATVTVHVLEVGEVKFTSISSNGVGISLDPNDSTEKTTGPNIELKWNALERADGIDKIEYMLEINGSKGIFNTQSQNSLEEFNIIPYAKNDTEYTCSITPKVEATYGGYSLGSSNIITLKRMTQLIVADDDVTFSTDTESNSYSWQKVIMEVKKKERYKTVIFCYKRSEENDTSLQKNSYEFSENETLSYTHQLNESEYLNGTEIEYSVIIKDKYGEEATKTKTIRRYKVPEIEIEEVEQDSAAEGAEEVHVQFKAKDEYANPNGETGFCSIFMGYKGQWVQLQNSEGSKFNCNIIPNISTSNTIKNLLVSYGSFKDVLTTLAQELKDFTVSIPKIEFKIRVWNSDIWNTESTKEYENEEPPYAEKLLKDPIGINYRREITNLTLTCEGYTEDEIDEQGKQYFSSGGVLTFTVGASFLGIDGEEAKDKLTYKITKNNDIIIKDNKDVLEDINSDTTYSYAVTATTPYKDGSTEKSKEILINVRRYLAPTISVSNLVLDDTEGLSGTIDYTINGSDDKNSPNENIGNITIVFEGEGIEREEVSFSIINSGKYPFKIPVQEQKTQVTVTFTIKTISTGGIEKTAYYGPVLIKSMGIPFAIRKEGIGVHAPKDFNPGHEDAALKVVGNSDTNTIAEFVNNSNRQGSNISLNFNDTKVYLSLQIDENGEPYFAVLFDGIKKEET